jgi:uncharacterized repeat protein (TIGR02543 family)
MIRKTVLTGKNSPTFISLGLIALLGLLCLLVSCKNDSSDSPSPEPLYTVSFDSAGGSAIADITNVPKGKVLNIGGRDYWPERPRCLFSGWYLQGDTRQQPVNAIRVEGNITLVAKWTQQFTVTLEMGAEGALGWNPNLTSFFYGSIFEAEAYTPFRKGFIFQYWYLKDDLSKTPVESIRIVEDITLVAEWEEGWTVTFVLGEGVYYYRNYITVAKADNATISLAGINLVREDYVFEGWYYDAEFFDPVPGDTVPVTGNMSLYVKWVPLSFFTSLLGVWAAGFDGPVYYLYFEESRLYGFYFSLDDIHSFTWTTSSLDGKRYSPVAPLSVGEGEDAKTFFLVNDKRTPAGNIPLNGTWIMAGEDDDLFNLYFGGGVALYLSADADEDKHLLGTGSIRASGRYLDISYMVTSGAGNLYLLKKNTNEVLLRIPIEDGKPFGYQKFNLAGPIHIF